MEITLDLAYRQGEQELAQIVNYLLFTLNIPTFLVEKLLQTAAHTVGERAEQEYQQHLIDYRAQVEVAQQKNETENKEQE